MSNEQKNAAKNALPTVKEIARAVIDTGASPDPRVSMMPRTQHMPENIRKLRNTVTGQVMVMDVSTGKVFDNMWLSKTGEWKTIPGAESLGPVLYVTDAEGNHAYSDSKCGHITGKWYKTVEIVTDRHALVTSIDEWDNSVPDIIRLHSGERVTTMEEPPLYIYRLTDRHFLICEDVNDDADEKNHIIDLGNEAVVTGKARMFIVGGRGEVIVRMNDFIEEERRSGVWKRHADGRGVLALSWTHGDNEVTATSLATNKSIRVSYASLPDRDGMAVVKTADGGLSDIDPDTM